MSIAGQQKTKKQAFFKLMLSCCLKKFKNKNKKGVFQFVIVHFNLKDSGVLVIVRKITHYCIKNIIKILFTIGYKYIFT